MMKTKIIEATQMQRKESQHAKVQISKLTNMVKLGLEADGSDKIIPSPSELPDREWRADSSDGLRPLKHIRSKF